MIQLGFQWILDREKLYCWQRYIKLFYPHLKDVETIDDFYFKNLDKLVHNVITSYSIHYTKLYEKVIFL